jgi:AcrR family transcriptional regulator
MAAGRPRAFDREAALDRALELFWRQGYEGTSIADLTGAMGINPPSLYAAFGNKEALFREAVDRYVEQTSVHIREAMAKPTARAAAETWLRGAAERATAPKAPKACMLVSAALACSAASDDIRDELAARRAGVEAAFRDRLQKGRADGDLPADVDVAALARYLATVSHGMSVQASGGATRKELMQVVDMTLRAFPVGAKMPETR